MIERIEVWLLRTFGWARAHPRLAFALALALAIVIVSPIPPIP